MTLHCLSILNHAVEGFRCDASSLMPRRINIDIYLPVYTGFHSDFKKMLLSLYLTDWNCRSHRSWQVNAHLSFVSDP